MVRPPARRALYRRMALCCLWAAALVALSACERAQAPGSPESPTSAESRGSPGSPGSLTAPQTPAPALPSDPDRALTVRDDQQRDVRLARPARRIASLSPALTEVVYAVGCGDRLVLRDRWSDYPAAARLVPAIDALSPSSEAILAAAPDLVLVSFPGGRLRTALDSAKVPWVGLAPQTIEAVASDLRRVATLCGESARGDVAARALLARVAAVDSALVGVRRPRTYLELDEAAGGRTWTVGDDTFAAAVLRAAGAVNAFPTLTGWPQISHESILAADPDVVLLARPRAAPAAATPGALDDAGAAVDSAAREQAASSRAFAARPGHGALRAVIEKRVLRVDPAIFGRPGPRIADAVVHLARALHPSRRSAIAEAVARANVVDAGLGAVQ